MLTNDSQASPGNTVKIGNDEVEIVDALVSTRGQVLIVKPTGDNFGGLAHVLVYPGDLLDSEDVEHVAGPVSPGQSAQETAIQDAQAARIARLEAQLASLEKNQAVEQQAVPVPADAEVVNEPAPTVAPEAPQVATPEPTPATDATGATDPGATPAPAPQVVQEG